MMKPAITLKQVIIDKTTDKAVYVRVHNRTFSYGGGSIAFWVPKTQMLTQPPIGSIIDLVITRWFWDKIGPDLANKGATLDFAFNYEGGSLSIPMPLNPIKPPLSQYKMLTIKIPSDAHEFTKSLVKFFDDPLDLEKFLESNFVIFNDEMVFTMNIAVKNNILTSIDEFKSDMIQSALIKWFEDNNK